MIFKIDRKTLKTQIECLNMQLNNIIIGRLDSTVKIWAGRYVKVVPLSTRVVPNASCSHCLAHLANPKPQIMPP